MVETNGVADPAQSIKQFWMDESMEIPAKLHSIVTIVPTHRLQQIKDDPIFKKEIVFSNKAILGFLDRVTLQEKQQALDYIKQLNPLITIEEYDLHDTEPLTLTYTRKCFRGTSSRYSHCRPSTPIATTIRTSNQSS